MQAITYNSKVSTLLTESQQQEEEEQQQQQVNNNNNKRLFEVKILLKEACVPRHSPPAIW